MRRMLISILLALAAPAQAQTSAGTIAPLPGSTPGAGELRGPGLPGVPNNRLEPLPNPLLNQPSIAPEPQPTPGVESATTPGFSATPTAPASATPGVLIELPPPAALAPASPSTVRTCPTGITFC